MTFLFALAQKAFAPLVTFFIIASLTLAPVSHTFTIKRAEAVYCSNCANIVTQGLELAKATLSAAYAAISSAASNLLQVKEYTLDAIAWALVDITLQQMARNMTRWINSGFEGDPTFVTDFGGFVRGVADKVAGDFIWKSDTLNFLCSPFQLDVKFALEFQYKQTRDFKTQCTLTQVMNNMDGFFNGDFLQGGWDGWYEVTTKPMNNPYGAMLVAEEQMSIRIRNSQGQEVRMLDWGRGFLSKKEGCDAQGNNCTITSPGTAIENQLNETLAGGQKRLHVADEINEMLAALFSQLAQQALEGAGGLLGLTPEVGAASSVVPSGTTNYFDQIAADRTTVGYSVSSDNPIQQAITAENDYVALQERVVDMIDNAARYKNAMYGESNQCSSGALTPTLSDYLDEAEDNISDSGTIIATLDTWLTDYLTVSDAQTPQATLDALMDKYAVATIPEVKNAILQEFLGYQASSALHGVEDTVTTEVETIPDVEEAIAAFTAEIDRVCRDVSGGP